MNKVILIPSILILKLSALRKMLAGIFFLFFFLIPISNGFAQTWINIELEQTEYDDATYKTCLKETGEPLNGNYAIKFNGFQTNFEPFTDGFKNGEAKVYRHKKLAEKGTYLNNLKEGVWFYYKEDGTIRKRVIYKKGKTEPFGDRRLRWERSSKK